MDCSTKDRQGCKKKQEYGPSGILYDLGSVYEGLLKLTDIRKAKGKIYSLDTILMIIVLAKLCGVDSPYAIADWAKNHRTQWVELLQLQRSNTPSHHTIRRIMGCVVYEEEVERLVAAYNNRVNTARSMRWMARRYAVCAKKMKTDRIIC